MFWLLHHWRKITICVAREKLLKGINNNNRSEPETIFINRSLGKSQPLPFFKIALYSLQLVFCKLVKNRLEMAGNTRRDIILIKDWGLQREGERERGAQGGGGDLLLLYQLRAFTAQKRTELLSAWIKIAFSWFLFLSKLFFSSQNVLILLS